VFLDEFLRARYQRKESSRVALNLTLPPPPLSLFLFISRVSLHFRQCHRSRGAQSLARPLASAIKLFLATRPRDVGRAAFELTSFAVLIDLFRGSAPSSGLCTRSLRVRARHGDEAPRANYLISSLGRAGLRDSYCNVTISQNVSRWRK